MLFDTHCFKKFTKDVTAIYLLIFSWPWYYRGWSESSCQASRKSLAMALQSPVISGGFAQLLIRAAAKLPENPVGWRCNRPPPPWLYCVGFVGHEWRRLSWPRSSAREDCTWRPSWDTADSWSPGAGWSADWRTASWVQPPGQGVVDPHWFNADPDPVPNPGFWWPKI